MTHTQAELLPRCNCYLAGVAQDKTATKSDKRAQVRDFGHARSCPLYEVEEPVEDPFLNAGVLFIEKHWGESS